MLQLENTIAIYCVHMWTQVDVQRDYLSRLGLLRMTADHLLI